MQLTLSIRARLLLMASVVLCGFALLFSVAQLEAYSAGLEDQLRRRLAADARTVLAAVDVRGDQLVMPAGLLDPRFEQVESDLVALIYAEDGRLLWRSPSAGDFEIDYRPRFEPDQVVFKRVSHGGEDYFIHDLDLRIGARGYSIITGDNTDEFDKNLRTYRRQLGLWLGASFVGVLLLLWLGLVWALRPLRDVRRQLAAVEQGKREQLEGTFPTEVAGLARGLNRLLTAEHARQMRIRTTLTELAHGLKTPLAVMTEMCRSLVPGDTRATLEQQIQRMNQQVSYQLQRTVPGRGGLASTRLALQPVLEKLCTALDKVYRDKQVRWRIELPGVGLALSEAQVLELFGNLLENAFRLCLSEVRVRARREARGLWLDVDDDGPGVPPALRERIVERGGRADSRHPGQGIGLAVVVDMLEELGGALEIADADLGGASFRLFFPAAVLA